jgi:glycosyltransferase involved in cell wall biosynthesis
VNIVYFADIRFPIERANGIQTFETCHALSRRGHQIALIVRPDTTSPARDPFEFYGLPRIDALRLEMAPVMGSATARRAGYLAFAAGRALGSGRADVLFTRDLGVASALLRIPRSMRAPLVYESHGYAPDVARALPDLVSTARPPSDAKVARLTRREARVWRSAEGYVTITSGLADEMCVRHGSRQRVAVIPDGVRAGTNHIGAAQRRSGVGGGRPIVAYAGHLYAWKGVEVLLEALARLPDVEGLIVGGHESEPDLAQLKARAAGLRVQDRVKFTGLVAPSRVAGLLRSADVLVLPNTASAISTRFTSPLKLFEYMAAGRPVVASDLPAIREVLRHEVTGLLVEPGNSAAIAAAIRRLVDEPGLGDRLARAAAEVVANYTWDRRAERIEALLRQVVGA